MKNIAYDEDNNFLQTIMGVGAVAGAGYGLHQYIYNEEGFKNVVKSVSAKVFPTKKIENNAHISQLEKMREVISASSKIQREVHSALINERHIKDAEKMSGMTTEKRFINSANIDLAPAIKARMEAHTQRYKINNTSEVIDIFGNSIGERYKEAIRGLGFGVSDDIGFDGTTGTFRLTNPDGTKGEVKIRFGKYDKQTSQWIGSTGKTHYVSKRTVSMNAKNGILHGAYMDPNTSMLLALSNKERLSHALAQNETYKLNVLQKTMASGNKKGLDYDALMYNPGPVNSDKDLQLAINSLLDVREEQIVLTSLKDTIRIGASMPTLGYDLQKLGETKEFAGLGSSAIGDMPGALTSNGDVKTSGEGLEKFFNFGTDVRNDNSRLKVMYFDQQSGKFITVTGQEAANLSEAAGMRGEAQFAQDAPRFLGMGSSTGKIADSALDVIPDLASTRQAESTKSLKQPFYEGGFSEFGGKGSDLWSKGDVSLMEFDGINIQQNELRNLRTRLLTVKPESTAIDTASYRNVISDLEKGGQVNLYGVMTPWLSDGMSFESKTMSQMKAAQPIQHTINEYLTGDLADELSRIEVFTYDEIGKKYNRRVSTFAELWEDSFHKDFLSNEKNVIKYKEGAVFGIGHPQNQVTNMVDLEAMIDMEDRFVRATADGIISTDNYLMMLAENRRQYDSAGQLISVGPNGEQLNDGLKIYANAWQDSGKFALGNSKTRTATATHSTRANRHGRSITSAEMIGEMLQDSGSLAKPEMILASDLFTKTFPKVVGNSLVLQKNAPEILPTMFNFINGNIFASVDTGNDIIVKGQAYEDILKNLTVTNRSGRKLQLGEDGFQEIINNYGWGKELNLTAMMKSGDLAWNPKTAQHEQVAAAKQLEEMTSLFGQLREAWVSNSGKEITSLDILQGTRNYDEYAASQLGMALDIGKASEHLLGKKSDSAADFFVELDKAFSTGAVNKHKIREITFPIFAGVNPQEMPALAQGQGFNTVRIPVQQSSGFLNKSAIFGEAISRSSSDSQMILEQYALATESLGKDTKQFSSHIESYQDQIGARVKIYDSEGLQGLFGLDILDKSYGVNLRDAKTELFNRSMFSKDVNPHGFAIQAKSGKTIFVPGAEYLGGMTYLGDGEKLTLSDHAMDWLKLVQDAAKSPKGATDEAVKSIWASMITHTTSTKSGPLRDASIKVSGGLFALHVTDKELIENERVWHGINNAMALKRDGAAELRTVLANSSVISRHDYYSQIKQGLQDALDVARNKGIGMSQAMLEMYGEDNFLQHIMPTSGLEKMDRREASRRISLSAERFTINRARKAKKLRDAMIELGNNSSNSHLDSRAILRQWEEQMPASHVQSAPYITGGSMSASYVVPDFSVKGDGKIIKGLDDGLMLRKAISVGADIAINENADFDGDKIGHFMLFGKESRAASAKVMRENQAQTARITQLIKKRKHWDNILKEVDPGAKGSLSFVGNSLMGESLSTEIASHLFEGAPRSTALAMYITKQQTGAFNTQANATKGWLTRLANKKGLNEQELETVMNYVGTFPSLVTEQQIISAKHLEAFLEKGGVTMDSLHNVTSLFANTSANEIEEIIKKSKGELHPVIKTMVSEGRSAPGMPELYKRMENLEDIQSMTRSFWNPTKNINREQEFKEAVSLAGLNPQEQHKAWEANKRLSEEVYSNGGEFLFENEAFKKLGWEGKTQIGLINDAIRESRINGLAIAQDSVLSFMTKHKESFKNGEIGEIMNSISMWNKRVASSSILDMTLSQGGQETSSVVKKIIGQESVEGMLKWLGKEPLRRGVMITGGAMLGMAALNILSGDGTPQNPNDLPSVNNPSFQNRKTDHHASRRTLNNTPSHNASIDLLTDSSVNYDSAMGNIDDIVSLRGYNSVSTRHDGVDPYRSDMYRYTN